MVNNVTFVTSYLKIYDTDYHESRTFEKRLNLFMKIVELDVNICLFVSREFIDMFDEIIDKYSNLKIVEVLSIDDLEFTKIGKKTHDLSGLPEIRNNIKDLPNYMFLMNSKIEFVKKTIDVNPFNNNYFCWLDFSLPYIFKDIENSLLSIKKHSESKYISTPFIAMPGCWNFKVGDINALNNTICWRFCGGLFFGDKTSLLNFYDVSIKHFDEFLHLTNKIVWEVNYWAWLEANSFFSPIWYPADHNDSIIDLPISIKEVLTFSLENCDTLVYEDEKQNSDETFPTA